MNVIQTSRDLLKKCRVFCTNAHHRVMFTCFLANFISTYTATYLFSFLPEMTLWLGFREEDKGYVAGTIASAYFLGSFTTSYVWGWLSDRVNRKFVIMVALVGNGSLCLAFGFCASLTSAVIVRFLIGAANGVQPVVRAVVFLYSKREHHARAISIIHAAWGLGQSVSPFVAGYLSSPTVYSTTVVLNSGIFSTYPYIMPAFFGFVINVSAAIALCAIYPSEISDINCNEGSKLIESDECSTTTPDYSAIAVQETNDSYEAISRSSDDEYITTENPNLTEPCATTVDHNSFAKTPTRETLCMRTSAVLRNSSIAQLLRSRNVLQPTAVFVLSCLSYHGFLEVFPVWTSTQVSLGGLGYTTQQIGLILGIISLPSNIIETFVVMGTERRIGSVASVWLFSLLSSVTMILLPLCRFIHAERLQWVAVAVVLFTTLMTLNAGFAACAIIINCSVAQEQLGAVNGLCLAIGSIGMALGPVVCGTIFSFSIESKLGGPVDASSAFVFGGVVLFVCTLVAYFLPKELDSRKCER